MNDARFRRSLVRGISTELDIRDRHIRTAADAQARADMLRRAVEFHDKMTALRREMDILNRTAQAVTREVAEMQARNDAVMSLLTRLGVDTTKED